tara:strand:- start:8231 stop:8893 length:663 start_codon:yes stop_codon:yes gene_type:complete
MELLNDIEIEDNVKAQISERLQDEVKRQIESEIAGLKAKNDELLAEKQQRQREIEEANNRAKKEAEEKARADNDYKQLFEAQKNEAETLRQTIEKMNYEVNQQKVSKEASKLASALTKDTGRAKLLEQQISQRLTLVDNEIRVTDESGQLTVSSLEELTNSIRTNYPFLVDGSQAQGGGAVRAQGRAEVRQRELSRSEFEGLSHYERQQFFEQGGKLFDD